MCLLCEIIKEKENEQIVFALEEEKRRGGIIEEKESEQIVLIKQRCTSLPSNKGVGQSRDVAALFFPRAF